VVAREGETVIGRAPRLYKPKILVVEDSDTMWFLYNDLLAGEYDLQRATDGRQALLELVRMKPDVIILDWTLDDIRPWDEEADTPTATTMRATAPAPASQKAVSGLEVLRVVKRTTFKATPVIMLTGHKGLHEKILGKLLRADKYLTKPLDEMALVKAVHALCPPRPAPTDVASAATRLSTTLPTSSPEARSPEARV